MSGSTNSLAVWFQEPIKANGPEDDYVRDDVLNEVYDFVWWGKMNDEQYAVITRGGRCLISKEKGLVKFTWNRSSEAVLYQFWMNPSSVLDIFQRLEKDKVNQTEYMKIFTGVR